MKISDTGLSSRRRQDVDAESVFVQPGKNYFVSSKGKECGAGCYSAKTTALGN